MASPVPGFSAIEVIGHGGYSVVYLARQESLGREVALKVDNRMVLDERDRRRFVREAQAAGRLSEHPNVISLFDAGITDDGRPYLVMELCRDGSLADRVRADGPLSPAQVREVGIRIADALAAAHDAGVLHRDLKPANILVNQSGSYGLSDFGLAATHEANQHLSGTVEAFTPAYAAPEMFRMDRPTVAVDVYGLGATLYALLAGRPPRWPAGGQQPSFATIFALQQAPIADVPGVSAAFNAVLRKALAVEPDDRYGSAAELRDALFALPDEALAPVDDDDDDIDDDDTVMVHDDEATVVTPVGGRTAGGAGGRQARRDRPPPRRPPGPAAPAGRPSRRRGGVMLMVLTLAVGLLALGGLTGAATDQLPFSSGRSEAEAADRPAEPAGDVEPNQTEASRRPGPPPAAPVRPTPAEVTPSRPVPPKQTPSRPPIVGADPDRITPIGYGPFRVGAPFAPLLAGNIARTPTAANGCDPNNQMVAADPRFNGVRAFKQNGKIDLVAVQSPPHATAGGLRVGAPTTNVFEAFPVVQEFLPPDGLRYLFVEQGNGLLFVDDGAGAIGTILAGDEAILTAIADGRVGPPQPCGI